MKSVGSCYRFETSHTQNTTHKSESRLVNSLKYYSGCHAMLPSMPVRPQSYGSGLYYTQREILLIKINNCYRNIKKN